ncbi:MAG TPA: LamG domain-containing protein [Anaerohalosphaeraceae bacterium]|mgnify:CR=1 FL=1|nr:LamG domain-containing protein [Anaerohalosphaeraceae bacterium]HPP55860.1 LamG domain-containing protein [Anaerohalosphaeraceae bacterium]
MRRRIQTGLAVLAVMLAAQAGAVELLVNGNLNNWTGGVPDGWYVYIANPNQAWFGMETSFTYDGSPCAVMYPSQGEWPGVELGQTVSFEPNSISVLHFSCVVVTRWYSSNNWGDATVEITYREPNGTYLAYDEFILFANNQYPVPTVWTAYNHDFTVPPGAGQATLVLRGSDWLKGVYWDNISLSYSGTTQAEWLSPANNSTIPWEDPARCGYGPTLRWKAAQEATGVHYVYLGTSAEAVANATTSSPEFLGTVPLGDPNFVLSLGQVVKGQTYYWRVDETTSSGVVKAAGVWRFTISPFTDLDLFDYASTAALQAVWGSGAVLNNGAMEIAYDHTGSSYLTEVAADADLFGCSTDWTRGGNGLLTLDVKGHDNMVDSIYVTLESNGGAQRGTVQYRDVRELNQQAGYEWFHFWPIALQEFAAQGVDLTAVSRIIIGVGTKASPTPGGAGSVLVNNLRLSTPMCLRGYTPADINQDCIADIYDFVEIAGNWLKEAASVTAQTPSRGPVLWYAFDEGTGTTVSDLSGFGYHGTIVPGADPNAVWGGVGSGIGGSNCLYLNNSAYVQVPGAAANIGDPNAAPPALGAESTISLWVKDPGQSDADSELFQIGQDGAVLGNWMNATGKFEYEAGGDTLVWTGSRYYSSTDLYSNPSHPQDEWVHYAFVKSASAGIMRIYQNGRLVVEMPAFSTYSPAVDDTNGFFSIGAWRWSGGAGGFVDGWIDDFRVYDYALSPAEVLRLAQEGGAASSPMLQPLIEPADVNGDSRIDLEDAAELARLWLQAAVYPD